LASSTPEVKGAAAIAKAICSAVQAWQAEHGTAEAIATPCPRVNGVCVTGYFVNSSEVEKGK
jgi:hypothetical protein